MISGNKKLLITSYFLLLTLLVAACGRRGDPILIAPPEETSVKKDSGVDITSVKGIGLKEEDKAVEGEVNVVPLEPPTGLIALYTLRSIVLTWDEVINRNIKGYNVYRSSGDDYSLIGKTVTPAFTDKKVEPNKKYYYRITAVGVSESPISKEIEVLTNQ